jgi:hypothetical protein
MYNKIVDCCVVVGLVCMTALSVTLTFRLIVYGLLSGGCL